MAWKVKKKCREGEGKKKIERNEEIKGAMEIIRYEERERERERNRRTE